MSPVNGRLVRVSLAAAALCGIGLAQSVALSLSSGSGTPGSVVTLNLSLNSSAVQAADLQWMLKYSVTDFTAMSVTAGSAVTAAGKSISCNTITGSPTCLLYGINSATVPNGVIASVALTISPSTHSTSSTIQLMNAGSASEPGLAVSTSGGTVTATILPPATYTISGTISPTAGGAGATATVKLSGAASATTTANSSGAYSFTGLANGSYTVTPSLSGYTYSPASQSVTISGANQTVNFTAAPVSSVTVTSILCNPDAVIPPAGSTCQVTLSGAAPTGGAVVLLSSNSPNVIEPASLTFATGAAVSSFSIVTTAVTANSTAMMKAGLGPSSASYPLLLLAPPPSNGLGVDVTVSQNSSSGAAIVSPSFSTSSGNELLLAFLSAGGTSSGLTFTSVAGGGLSWVLTARENVQNGTAEIWRAFSSTLLSNVSVTAALSANASSSITVMSFTGVDPSGVNGAGAIGATAVSDAASAPPSVTLTTTRDGSWVLGVGTDARSAASRVPAAGQNIVHQSLTSAQTYWVQQRIATTPESGTSVAIADTSPVTAYNMSAVEIRPPAACVVAAVPQYQSFGIAGGSTSVQVADGMGCNWTVSTDSPSWITIAGVSGTGNGSFTYAAAPSLGPTQMGTITVGNQPFKVLDSGTTVVFADTSRAMPYFDYINLMYYLGISPGCSASPLDYCPSTTMTRGQMAAFVVAAIDGIDYVHGALPKSYTTTPYFADVPAASPYFPYVQRLADLKLADSCSTAPAKYCPANTETHGQMAELMILGWMYKNNLSSFTYSLYPYFTDVPVTNVYFPYIQKMRDMSFWNGCSASNYCPGNAVLESDMAALVLRSLLGAPRIR